jgi:TonB family protein
VFAFISSIALVAAASGTSAHKAPEPKGSMKGLISSDDYPAEALDHNEQGTVAMLIRVDDTGAISDCIIEKSSGFPILDNKTCELIRQRAKFQPARDRHGRPVASETHGHITWRIGENMMPSDPWAIRTVIDFGANGKVVACRIEYDGAIHPRPGTTPPPCSPIQMNRNVASETRFEGAIDKIIIEDRFSPGSSSAPQLAPNQVLVARGTLHLGIDVSGKLASCKLMEVTAPLEEDACAAARKEYTPRKGPGGKPTPFTATETLSTVVQVDRNRQPPGDLSKNLQGLISADDYPAEALDKNEQGTVGVLLRVGPSGTVSDCIVEQSSGYAVLDKQTCDVLRQRAKFMPALDREARPTSGEYRARIEWKIADDWTPSDPWVLRTVINFAPDGRPISCRLELEGAMKPPAGQATPPCDADAMASVPVKVADLPSAIATLVMEQSFAIGRVPVRPLAAGNVLVLRQVVSLDIDAEGKLTSCKVVEQTEDGPQADACTDVDKEYVPRKGPNGKPAPFHATETILLYVRVEKVALDEVILPGSGR